MPRKAVKRESLTAKQQRFVEEYTRQGGRIDRVARALNLTPRRVRQYIETPVVRNRLAENVDIARRRIESAAPHLVDLALDMVDDEDLSPKVRASLLDSLLDRAGVSQPKEPAVAITINTQISERARQILAERQKAQELPQPTIQIEATKEE